MMRGDDRSQIHEMSQRRQSSEQRQCPQENTRHVAERDVAPKMLLKKVLRNSRGDEQSDRHHGEQSDPLPSPLTWTQLARQCRKRHEHQA